MPYVRPTINEIVARIEADMESRLTGDVSLLLRGILRVLARVFAGAIHIVYGYIEYLADQLFATTAELDYLNRIGLMFGVTRKAAVFAEGTIAFDGDDTTLIPEGTRVIRQDGIEYETTADGTITGGVVVVAGIAVEAGTGGNSTAGDTVELIEPIVGVDALNIQTHFQGGDDEETDDEYRARILLRLQTPPAGGTAADFERWAREVSGVDNAWTFAAFPGPGQVTVVFTGSASVSTVEDYLTERMPVTTDLTVQEATELNVDFTISLSPNSAAVQAAVTANLTQLFDEVAEPGEDILISQVRNAISTSGVDDYTIDVITVDGSPRQVDSDIQFTDFEYGILDDLTYQAL